MTSTTQQEQSSPQVEPHQSPTLYIEHKAMAAVALSELSAGGRGLSWFIPAMDDPARECNLCQEGITYKPLAEAPSQLLAVARQLEEKVEGVALPASESDTIGRAFVITTNNTNSSNSGREVDEDNDEEEDGRMADNQVRDICLDALGIIDDARAHATVTRRDWAVEAGRMGFCYTDEEIDEDEDIEDQGFVQSDLVKVVDATRVMADELQSGFEFNFDRRVVCGPVLYGGFVGQNSIVGMLSMRVWT